MPREPNERRFYRDETSELPDRVREVVASVLGTDPPIKAVAVSDVGEDYRFKVAWLVLADHQLLVIRPEENPPFRSLLLKDHSEAVIYEGRGLNRFRLIRDGALVEEFRYTRRQAHGFSELHQRCRGAIAEEAPLEFVPVPADIGRPDEERLCPKCARLIPEWTDACPRCLQKRKILWRLLGYSRPYAGSAMAGLFAALVMAMLMLVPPVLTQRLIDDVLAPMDASRTLWMYALLGVLALVIVVRVICTRFRFRLLAFLGERIAHDLRTEAYEHLQKLSLAFFNKKPTGQLISRISHDTDRLWDFIAFGIIDVLMAVATIIGVCAVMLWYSPALAALTILPLPLGIFITYLHTIRIRRTFHRIWRKWSRMTAQLSDTIPGVRVVKAFTQEGREVTRFSSRSREVMDEAIQMHAEWTSYWPKVTLLLQMGNLIIWAYAGPRILEGEFTLGSFVMFTTLIWLFYGPVEQLGMMNRVFQRAATSAQRVFEILDTPPTIFSRSDPVRLPRVEGRVTFNKVTFSYDGIKRVLQDVSFDVAPGEMIGLAGPSGGGKTTLINLICRFYDVQQGGILVDGHDIRDLDVHELRSQVGIVLQEPFLFSGTIAANIAYGNEEAERDTILTASKAANAHDFIVGFPDGYDTVVGERGQTLSGGERQRISIARAILNNPRILILDEATSSVDTETEKKIQEAIGTLVKGRTTFAIAHRLSTLRSADRLIILDKGKLAQIGTHEELLKDGEGQYAKLNRTQEEMQSIFAV
jgi:ATP-binding cassette subfamily B protein